MRREKMLCRAMFCILLAAIFGLVRPVHAEDLKIGGCIDMDLSGSKHKGANSTSDLKLDSIGFSIESVLNEHVSANAFVKYEYQDADYKLFVDEAYITLSKLTDQPFTVTAGKWYLPFGVYNNHMVNDPLTEDAYEINSPAVSFAITPEEVEGVDLSLTLYSSSDARYADPANNHTEDDFGNYILNASFEQAGFLNFSVYFASEQGAGGRNDSLGASMSATYMENLTFDVEYITALERDDTIRNDLTIPGEDTAYSIAGAFKVLPALELVGRFEGYDDGVSGYQPYVDDSLVGVEYRVSAGANYELFENALLMSEFRVTELEDPGASNLKEWILRLRVEF